MYKPLDTAVPHQFFATSMVITPLVRGLLGLDVDAPAGRLTLAPRLPAEWDSVRIDGIAVGRDQVSAVIRRQAHSLLAEVWRTRGDAGRPIDVEFAPALPLGATGIVSMAQATDTVRRPGAVVVSQTTRMRERVRMGVTWSGGWDLVAPVPAARIGDRSQMLRVTAERLVNAKYIVTLQGRARHVYRLRVRGPAAVGAVTVEPASMVMPPLELGDRDAQGWQNLQLVMPATGGDADDFVTLTLAFEVQQ